MACYFQKTNQLWIIRINVSNVQIDFRVNWLEQFFVCIVLFISAGGAHKRPPNIACPNCLLLPTTLHGLSMHKTKSPKSATSHDSRELSN